MHLNSECTDHFYWHRWRLTIFREKKKKGGKVDAKKAKSGGEKERKKEAGNDSFKSKEFISSEESSSESDHGKGSKRKVHVLVYLRF